jgi:hypothetical protein
MPTPKQNQLVVNQISSRGWATGTAWCNYVKSAVVWSGLILPSKRFPQGSSRPGVMIALITDHGLPLITVQSLPVFSTTSRESRVSRARDANDTEANDAQAKCYYMGELCRLFCDRIEIKWLESLVDTWHCFAYIQCLAISNRLLILIYQTNWTFSTSVVQFSLFKQRWTRQWSWTTCAERKISVGVITAVAHHQPTANDTDSLNILVEFLWPSDMRQPCIVTGDFPFSQRSPGMKNQFVK